MPTYESPICWACGLTATTIYTSRPADLGHRTMVPICHLCHRAATMAGDVMHVQGYWVEIERRRDERRAAP